MQLISSKLLVNEQILWSGLKQRQPSTSAKFTISPGTFRIPLHIFWIPSSLLILQSPAQFMI
jgi:hypothetical protein